MTELKFLNKYGHPNRGFWMKNLNKITWQHLYFCESWRFLTKYGHESSVCFRELTFLSQYGHESSWFFVTNRKKRHYIDFSGIGFLFYYTFLVIFLLYLEIFEKSLLYLFWLYLMIFRRVGYTFFIIPILFQNCLLYLSLLYFLWRV